MRLTAYNSRDYGRQLLWAGREEFLVHMLEPPCPIRAAIEIACRKAGWDYESYFLAAMFDDRSLIEERRGSSR